jgi:hypothetical protein
MLTGQIARRVEAGKPGHPGMGTPKSPSENNLKVLSFMKIMSLQIQNEMTGPRRVNETQA